MYIPPDGNMNQAESALCDGICNMEDSSPDAAKIISGDINDCDL